ncbi:MAG: GIY-YIG nuclease family protein [Caulobacteraceae bacterium]|nr:GIY-YIG nuclease family protein [Caulobacter sp.]RYF95535.1 MAG: GIY-YIG nuclease family protein [Caulobacteraceae bacterium]
MTSDRKQLVRDYKDRQIAAGAFAVRCAPSSQAWVEVSPNLHNRQNGLWFSLRLGSHPNRALVEAWKTHGEEAFTYEVVEELPDAERSPWELANALKALSAKWRTALNAEKLTG